MWLLGIKLDKFEIKSIQKAITISPHHHLIQLYINRYHPHKPNATLASIIAQTKELPVITVSSINPSSVQKVLIKEINSKEQNKQWK